MSTALLSAFIGGMRTAAELYLHEEILAWQSRLYEFKYIPVLSRADVAWTGRRGYTDAQ